MIQEFTIKLNDRHGRYGVLLPDAAAAADDAAGPASNPSILNDADVILDVADPHANSRPPRRGRRTKPRRNTSLSTASTSYFSDSLSTVDHNFNPGNEENEQFEVDIHDDESSTNSYAISTEVSDELYFEEIEKLIDESEDNTTTSLKPTVSIAAKMQARLLSRHLKTRRLRRVVSHSAASSMQDNVDLLNEVSGAGGSSAMRTVFSFSDMREHGNAEEHQMLTDCILENIVEEDDDEDAEAAAPAPNAEFEEFVASPEDQRANVPLRQQQQATLKPHPNMMPTTMFNDDGSSTKTSERIGFIPFFPPPQPGGLRRANTSAATHAASAAGRAMLASPTSLPRKSFTTNTCQAFPGISKPKVGNLQRSKTDSLACVGGISSDRNSRKIKEVTVKDFYDLLRLHQSQTL